MWFFFTTAVASEIFKGEPGSAAYGEGSDLAGLAYSFENIVTFLFALVLPFLAAKIGQKWTHFTSLLIGGLGLMLINFVDQESTWMLFLIMGLVGIAWSSILSMPYAILAGSISPKKMGVYMGIFNFFIVIPQIINALIGGPLVKYLYNDLAIYAIITSGVSFLIAAALVVKVKDVDDVIQK
jgi:maltose/moltooligosaccharide transporter